MTEAVFAADPARLIDCRQLQDCVIVVIDHKI